VLTADFYWDHPDIVKTFCSNVDSTFAYKRWINVCW